MREPFTPAASSPATQHTAKLCCLIVLTLLIQLSQGAVLQFQATLTPGAVVPEDPADSPSLSTASGTATFTLITGGINGPELSYSIDLQGLTFDTELPRATSTGPDTLVRAVHIHFGAAGTNGIHALNVYGVPREDDSNLNVLETSISGIWDDSDENFGADAVRDPSDSIALSDALDALQNQELFIQVHTFGYRQGELRGQISAVPEPSTAYLIFLASGTLLFRRMRN